MNDDNLIRPMEDLTANERRESASRAGVASGKARRAKRDMARLASIMLAQGTSGTKGGANVSAMFPDLGEDVTMAAQVVAGQINAAAKGNVRAARYLDELAEREAAREGRERRYEVSPMDLTTDMVRPYRDLHAFYDGTIDLDDMVFRGGRGGAKSTLAAQLALETMMQDDAANVVFGRRYSSDLRHTVYTSFVRLLNERGLAGDFEVTRTPLRCTRRDTGTAAYFFGMDNAEQLKSFVPEVGYVKLLVFEEADEMMGDEQMDSAADTFLRANGQEGARQLRLKVFNPPASRNNFMNEWCATHVGDPRSRVYDFSFLNVPPEWLGQTFLDRAARAKAERPEWYRNNYLGEVTGEGGELFGDVEERRIADDEAWRLLDRSHQGLDFGYEHPMAFVRVAYDPEARTVYALSERVERHADLGEFMRGVQSLDVDGPGGARYEAMRNEVICDAAEPDRIRMLLDWGWDAVASVKRWRGGGRAYSWDWLRTRHIVVDPSRTPHLAHELRTLEFERVRGGFSSRYPDLGEDAVMATIYALNRIIRRAAEYDGY